MVSPLNESAKKELVLVMFTTNYLQISIYFITVSPNRIFTSFQHFDTRFEKSMYNCMPSPASGCTGILRYIE